MELIKSIKRFFGVIEKPIAIEDPNTIENLKLLMLENLDLKKSLKTCTLLNEKISITLDGKDLILSDLETRVVNTERMLKEATGNPLNMDQVAAYLNHKGFIFESDKGDSVWRQKPQPAPKPKKKKIDWDKLELTNNPNEGLKAKLVKAPKKKIIKTINKTNIDLTKSISPSKL